jgi:hypothetical protein
MKGIRYCLKNANAWAKVITQIINHTEPLILSVSIIAKSMKQI